MVAVQFCAISAFVSAALAQQVPVAVPSSSELAGTYLWSCSELKVPMGCAITHDGLVAVADAAGEVVGLSAADGSVRWRASTAGSERLLNPAGIAVLSDGSLLVTDVRRGRVDRFGADGSWKARFAPAVALAAPTSIAVGTLSDAKTECVAVVDEAVHEIVLLSTDGNEICRVMRDRLLMKDGSHALPSHVAFVGSGLLAVSSTQSHQIFVVEVAQQSGVAPTARIDAPRTSTWGGRGPFPGLFNQPMGIAFDGGWLWIADEFNHRVARQSCTDKSRGEGKLAYGQHAVFPRAGEGAVHYPVAIAVAHDVAMGSTRGPLAVVCEPFERRVQAFVPSALEEPADVRLILPKLEGVQSHFGGAATIAGSRGGERLFLHDPESATIVVFDLSRAEPAHVSTLSGAGTKPHESGRIDAMVALRSGQRLLVADGANRRLALWELTPPPKDVIFEPFMGRLVKTRAYARLDLASDATIVSLAQDAQERIFALCPDGPRIVTLDRSLRRATTHPITAPDTTARAVAIACADDGSVGVLFDSPAVICQYRFEADQWVAAGTVKLDSVVHGRNLAAGAPGEWWVVDDASDTVVVTHGDATPTRVGSRGVADGAFWLPAACARDANGAMYVVDSGNHRSQRFSADGVWQMTFSLGRTYTRARTADEVLKVRKKPTAATPRGPNR